MVALAALLGLCGSVEFKADLYTMEEIASLLSTETQKVEVRLPLKRAAVLLSLRGRPLDQQRKIICETLQLDLIEVDQRLVLVRSAEFEARNQRRQEAFVADLHRLGEALAGTYKDAMSELVRLDAEKIRVSDDSSRELSLLSYPDMGPWTYFSATNLPRFSRSILWYPLVLPKVNIAAPPATRSYWQVEEAPRLRYEVLREFEIHAFVSSRDGRDLERRGMSMFTVQVDSRRPAEAVYLGSKTSVPTGNLGLGKAEADWFLLKREASRKLLDNMDQASFSGIAQSLSEAMLLWARHTGKEVAMELNPAHEDLPHRCNTVSAAFASERWFLEDRSGVLVAYDPLSFLGPPWQEPVARLVQLARNTKDQQWPYEELASFADLFEFVNGRSSVPPGPSPLDPKKELPYWSSILRFCEPIFYSGEVRHENLSAAPARYHGVPWHFITDHLGVSFAYSLVPPLTKSRMFASKRGQTVMTTEEMAPRARRRFYELIRVTQTDIEPLMGVLIRWSEGPRSDTRRVSLRLVDSLEDVEEQEWQGLHFPWQFIDVLK